MLKMMEECSGEALKEHPPDSFQHVLAATTTVCSSKRQATIKVAPPHDKWALYIQHLSVKAYDTIRESGFIALPFQRTLRDHIFC